MCSLSRFWRLEVWHQAVSRAVLPPKALWEDLLHTFLPAPLLLRDLQPSGSSGCLCCTRHSPLVCLGLCLLPSELANLWPSVVAAGSTLVTPNTSGSNSAASCPLPMAFHSARTLRPSPLAFCLECWSIHLKWEIISVFHEYICWLLLSECCLWTLVSRRDCRSLPLQSPWSSALFLAESQ